MATNTSPSVIEQMIQDASVNLQGVVQWDGTNGLENIVGSINANTVFRGIMYFPDTTSMSKAGSNQSQYAICSAGGGFDFYIHFPQRLGASTSISSSNGEWRLISSSGASAARYFENITLSILEGAVVTHNFNNQYPEVIVVDSPENNITLLQVVVVYTNANSIEIKTEDPLLDGTSAYVIVKNT